MSKLFKEVKKIMTIESRSAETLDSATNSAIIKLIDDLCVPVYKIEVIPSNRMQEGPWDRFGTTLVYTVKEFDVDNMTKFFKSMFSINDLCTQINDTLNLMEKTPHEDLYYSTYEKKKILDFIDDIKVVTNMDEVDRVNMQMLSKIRTYFNNLPIGECDIDTVYDYVAGLADLYSIDIENMFDATREEFEGLIKRFCRENNIDIDNPEI